MMSNDTFNRGLPMYVAVLDVTWGDSVYNYVGSLKTGRLVW